jgi:uncharacterized phage protein (TIGR02218 family)
MKTASAALIAYLNAGTQFIMADLYTFTVPGQSILYYTNADSDITYNGNVFKAFLIARTRTRVSVGVEVDAMEITINPSPNDTIALIPWTTAARYGMLDGSSVKLEKLYMPTFGDSSLGAINMFQGRISDINIGRTEVRMQVKSELELLNTMMPRDFYQSSCLNSLFDNGCTLSKSNFAYGGTIGVANLLQMTTNIANAAGFFDLGTVLFNSGPNLGTRRSIRSYSGGVFIFSLPLTVAPLAGSSFIAYPGCDKLKTTCESKFNNVINFRGYPFIPDPEVAA